MTPALDTINWHSFLGRPAIAASSDATTEVARETVLITGAGGSIGSALAQRLASEGARVIALESCESNLFDLQSHLIGWPSGSSYLGTVDDYALLNEIFAVHRPRIVFHAAAFKHVPLLEEQPFAAISNNVFGTETLVRAALAHRARVVLLSTDKAVSPASIMGATKRIAEQMVLSSGGAVLRLGNVLASRGSVSEIFANRIAAALPLTVTDPAVRRYFLTIDEAVNLLMASAIEPGRPVLLAPRIPSPHYIADLARFMAGALAPACPVRIEFTHLRPGDKDSEQLWSPAEVQHCAHSSNLILLESPMPAHSRRASSLQRLHECFTERDLPAALAVITDLVADYTPSSLILGRTATAPSQLSHE